MADHDDLRAAVERVTAFLEERPRPRPFACHTLRPSDLRTILAALAERIADRGGDDQ